MSESQPSTSSIWGWQGASSGISQCTKHILETGQQSDVHFAVGQQHGEVEEFRAHKLILSIRSEVFWTMFYGDLQEPTEKTIKLPDILPRAFSIMLKYVYTDVVEDLDWETAFPTIYCAQKYGIPKLVDICTEYTIKNVDTTTCLAVWEAAKDLDAAIMVEKCLEFIDKHCGTILQSDEFLSLKNEALVVLFSRNSLVVIEQDVYSAAKRWALEACRVNHLEPTATNVRNVLGPVLFQIRFPLLDDRELADGPAANGLLLNEELLQLYQFKHGSNTPEIPFSCVMRSKPSINFSERQWIVLDKSSKGCDMMTGNNVFVDEHGYLHLRLSQQNGVWKGAGIQLVDVLGCGRYEFHVQGRLDQLNPSVVFAMSSQAENVPGIGIQFAQWGEVTRESVRWGIWRRTPATALPMAMGLASSDGFDFNQYNDFCTTHSYDWSPDSVSFSSQYDIQLNNTEEEFREWSYTNPSPQVFPLEPLSVSICLCTYDNGPPSDGAEVEVILRSFRFYPH